MPGLRRSTRCAMVPAIAAAGRARAHDHRRPGVRARVLRDRHVRNRGHRLAGLRTPAVLVPQVRVLRVADDADDLVGDLGETRFFERAQRGAERIHPVEMAAHEALVHHHHAARARVVEILEVAAGTDRDSQRLEVAGADVGESRRLALAGRAGDAEEVRPRCAAQRHVRRRHRCRHARHRSDLARQLVLERGFSFGGERVRRTIHERNHERAFGLEAGWHRGEVSERLHEEQCREDEHERQRDLRDDEPALESGAMAIDRGAARAVAHDRVGVDERDAQRGQQSEEDGCQCRCGADERHQPPVAAELKRDRPG